MDIFCDRPEDLADLIRLNELWIKEHFSLEAADRSLAADPGSILRGGGHTICAVEDGRVVGAVALFQRGEQHFELARMAVDPDYRRRGIGRALALFALEKGLERGARRITLLSNTVLEPAIALYRSLGFRAVREGQDPEYARCNVVMEKTLGASPLLLSSAGEGALKLAGRRFRLVENSTSGVAGANTVLSFTSDDDLIVGHYEGGGILVGHVLARRSGGGELEMLYQGATRSGQLRAGAAAATFCSDDKGGTMMTLAWRWLDGDRSSGTSVWELISRDVDCSSAASLPCTRWERGGR